MKKLIITFGIVLVQVIGNLTTAQEDGTEIITKVAKVEIATSILEEPIEVGMGQLVPVFGYRKLPNTKLDDENYDINAFELGVGILFGDSYRWTGSGPLGFLVGGGSSWQYVAPYLSIEARNMLRNSDTTRFKLKEFATPVMINAGAQFGFGDSDVFFVGFGGDVALTYDFNNLYGKFSAGIDLAGFGVHFGGYVNFTKNGDYANYLSGGFIELRLMPWRRD